MSLILKRIRLGDMGLAMFLIRSFFLQKLWGMKILCILHPYSDDELKSCPQKAQVWLSNIPLYGMYYWLINGYTKHGIFIFGFVLFVNNAAMNIRM